MPAHISMCSGQMYLMSKFQLLPQLGGRLARAFRFSWGSVPPAPEGHRNWSGPTLLCSPCAPPRQLCVPMLQVPATLLLLAPALLGPERRCGEHGEVLEGSQKMILMAGGGCLSGGAPPHPIPCPGSTTSTCG
eukprot:1154393-Pelagomonas_calceolata.AAC.4